MIDRTESVYFSERAKMERELSKTASDLSAAKAHAKLAQLYEERAMGRLKESETRQLRRGVIWAG